MIDLYQLAIISGIGLFIWQQGNIILRSLIPLFVSSFEVHSSEIAFDYYLEFFDRHRSNVALNNTRFSITTALRDKSDEGKWYNGLGYGIHLVRYKNRFILLRHVKLESQVSQWYQTATLYAFTLGKSNVFDEITSQLYVKQSGQDETKIYIYQNGWVYLNTKTQRPIDSIFWESDKKKDIIDDVNTFIDSKKTYIARGTPYKRSYLFYGPPGTGKTSMIFALAGYFGYNIAVLNLSTIEHDNQLITAFSKVPNKSFLLLEDIDLIFQKLSKGEKTDEKNRITFSGILNALDGIAYKEGLVTFMTTNHIDRLDPAVIRTGRVDKQVLVDNINKQTALTMMQAHGMNKKDALSKLKTLRSKKYNPSVIQNILTRS